MYIQYRLFSEHSLWRVLEINKSENYILVSELKNIIRKQSNINYNNKIDIYFSLYQNEDEEDINKKTRNISKEIKYLDVDDKIYNGNKILVHRDVKKKNNVHDITHIAKKEIILDVEEKQKVNLPNEFLCKICNYMLIESYIIVCNNNCGYSVCKSCILFYIFSCIIKEDEKKKNYIDLSLVKNDDNIIKCPICKGVLKYCIVNKKMELTLKKLQDERNDIDSFNFIIQERNNKFMKIIEKMKIQNFDYSSLENRNNDGTNINTLFNNHIFKTIEEKYIYSTNNNNNKKVNEQIKIEEKTILNHFMYLMDSNKLNSMKEYQMIYIDFDSCIFDTIQKMNIKNISEHINGSQSLQDILDPDERGNTMSSIAYASGVTNKIDNKRLDPIKYEKNENMNNNTYSGPTTDQNNDQEEIDEKLYTQNKTYIIPISFVGGETSYSLIGVFYISDLVTSFNSGNGRNQNEKDFNNKIENFMMKWHANESGGNNISKENIMNKLKNGDIYKVEYVNKYEKTCFIPVRKQPLYNIVNTKRNKTKKKTNIEIVLDFKKFMEVVLTVDNYIRYGSRPNNYEIKKVATSPGDDISGDTGMSGGLNIPFNNMDENEKKIMNVQKNKEIQDISYMIGNNQDMISQINYEGTLQPNYPSENISILTKHSEFQEIYEILYSTKVAPVSIQNNFNINNPYADYCAILPFLTKEEFLFFRKLQRIYKEKYLKRLYKHVKENNLNINIFSNAVNSIFFSTIR
ncbi:conserved Plasmodium protein, unknown function [Plasmodium chabaudi chabaudi]|uniref:RING-type domain-containing protein n=1 Tax=Plasmodium chabaudi chabaudi TaxID=31271 RepID=A0A1C6X1P2_PLACU|nr:conserved Plasmodium protein, unknown function [Plasmodium chabaudi chabaudi]